MLVLGAVPGIPANYPSVKMILDNLNMEALDFTMSLDVKMRKLNRYELIYISSIEP